MKPLDTFDDAGGASEDGAFVHLDARADHFRGHVTAAVPDAALLFSGAYHQSGNDLVITRPFETVTIHDYFRYDEKPSLVAPDGSTLSGAVVVALTEGRPGTQYAGDEAPARGTAIGRVESVAGPATVVRNGQTVTLHVGDLVFKGDAVETGEQGTLAITFIDGTAFTLAESARMVLNDMVFEPGGSNNSSLLSLVQGSITFVAGEVAHTGEMKVDTPVATMGIRGTAVHVTISAHNGPTRFSVMREPNGRVGSYILYDHKSGAALATVADVGNVVELQLSNGQIIINTAPKTPLDFQQEQALTSQVFQTFQAGQQDSLLKALMQPQNPSGEHGSSGPPQTGPSGGQPGDTTHPDSQPAAPTINQAPPAPIIIPPVTPPSTNDPLPVLTVPATPPSEIIILAKNATVESALSIPSETVTSVQAGDASPVDVGPNGATIAGLYGHLTIDADGTFHYVADHAATLGAGALGFDVFNYTVTNASGSTATAALTFDVIGASNNPIVAGSLTAGTVSEKSVLQTLNLLSGAASPNPNEAVTLATDSLGHPAVQVSVVSGPVAASTIAFSVDANGHLTIDPSQFSTLTSTQSETLSFSYMLIDASGGATPQTATITIDGAPLASYGAQNAALYGASGISGETVALTSATGDDVSLDRAQLMADGWAAATAGTYTQSTPYGTATLAAQGNVSFALNGTAAPSGVATHESFSVPFVDTFGIEISANASFTIDGAPLASYGAQSAPLLGTIGSASETITLTNANDDATGLDTAQLAADGWHGAAAGTYTQSGLYGTAMLDASGNVSYVLNGTPAPAGVATLESFNIPFIDADGIEVTAMASFTIDPLQPSVSVSGAQTIGVGKSAMISGISLSESDSASDATFTLTVSDMHGTLSATDAVVSNSGTSLTLSGTLTQIKTDLLTLTDTDATPGFDMITIGATDSLGNSAMQQTVAVMVSGLPEISVPGVQTISAGIATAINSISLSETDSTGTEIFTVTLTDTYGNLSANGIGVSNSSSHDLILTGTLSDITNDLGTVTDTDSTSGVDTITVNASDSFGNSAIAKTIEVIVPNELVSNGGFENGNLSGWSTSGYRDHTGVNYSGTYADPHSGAYALTIGPIGSDFDLDQTISTVSGEIYQVQFWLSNPTGGTPNDFSAKFGGDTLMSLTNANAQPYTEYTFDVEADSSATDLHFAARQDPAYWYLDDISVIPLAAAAIANGSSLELGNAVPIGSDISFDGATGILTLDQPLNFNGDISGISGSGDVLNLHGFTAADTTATTGNSSYNSVTDTTTLTVIDTSDQASELLTLVGDYSHSTWTVTDDHNGGVDIVDPPASSASSTAVSELTASAESDTNGGDNITLTGLITGTNDTATIAWNQGSAMVALALTNGVFTTSQDLTAGDHQATITLTDTATNAQSSQTIDIDIGGSDAPFVFAPTTGLSVIIGSASANVSQTITGSSYADTIIAGAGNDTIAGNNTGGDTFVFKTAMGNDQITDLHTGGTGGAHDVIDVSAFHFANYQALLAATATDASGDSIIALGTHTLTLDHVQKADLQSDLFHL